MPDFLRASTTFITIFGYSMSYVEFFGTVLPSNDLPPSWGERGPCLARDQGVSPPNLWVRDSRVARMWHAAPPA